MLWRKNSKISSNYTKNNNPKITTLWVTFYYEATGSYETLRASLFNLKAEINGLA
jgi:hypothetical protein